MSPEYDEQDLSFRSLFEAVPTPCLVLRTDHPRFTIVAATDAYCRATMTQRRDLVERGILEAFDADHQAKPVPSTVADLIPALETVLRTRAAHRMPVQRYDVRRPDGSMEVHYWMPLNSPVLDSEGEVRYILHQAEDITAHLMDRAAAEAAEHRASHILERMGDGVLLLDSQLRIVYVNPAGERLMQVPRDRVIGQPARTVFPGVLDPDAERHYERVISERTAAHFTQQYRNGDREFFAEIDAYPTEDHGIAIFWRDVTARVQAEAAVRASEAKYRLLFDSIDEAFCVAEVILDDAGKPVDYVVLEANPEFVRQTGLENPVGRRIRELIPAHEERWIQTIGRVATSGEAVRFQDRVEALNRWYDVFAFRFGDPEDRTVAILFLDISAARSVEEQRELLLVAESEARSAAERARIEADAASRAKSDFLAVMSHELRTPLNAIGGYAELMEMGLRGPITEQQAEDLARIQRSQRHLLGLVNQVLNYARLETGSVNYDIEDVIVCDVLATAESLIEPQARSKGIVLDAADCPSDLTVRADADKLRQIVINLLSNAVKFTDAGGRIDVACRPNGDRVYISVRDTGIGIPAERLESIFEPFVQVRADLTRTAEGTGLGLAISRDLALGMGGDLTAESAPGSGSVFVLWLPRGRDQVRRGR